MIAKRLSINTEMEKKISVTEIEKTNRQSYCKHLIQQENKKDPDNSVYKMIPFTTIGLQKRCEYDHTRTYSRTNSEGPTTSCNMNRQNRMFIL